MSDLPLHPHSLAEQVRRGDLNALAAQFAQHRGRLLRTVEFRMDQRLQGRIDPDDVLQEAYLAAGDRLSHFEGNTETELHVWLRLIVLQTLTDLHRRHLGTQKRDAGREISIDGQAPVSNTSTCMAIQLSGKLTSPSLAAIREEQSLELQNMLDGMNDIDREILALRHFEELTNSETAEVLGIEQKAASIRYIRALRRLKEVLSKANGLSDHGTSSLP